MLGRECSGTWLKGPEARSSLALSLLDSCPYTKFGMASVSPNSTNISATLFGDSEEYANMINSKSDERRYDHCISMLLKALIVRSTTQKDEKPFRTRKGIDLKPARPGDVPLSLGGTDKLIVSTIEGT